MKTIAQFPDKLQFLFEPHRFKVLYGGRAGSKSWGIARAILSLGARKPLRILAGREIQKSLKDSVKKLFEDQIQSMGLQDCYQVLTDEIRGKNNSTEIFFSGLRHNIDNIKSLESVDLAWIEEAQVVSKASWDKLIPSIRKAGSEIWISFNPDLETDETYDRFVMNPPEGSFVQKINYQDNPWVSEETRMDIRDVRKRSEQDYLHIYEGHCKSSVEGAIFAQALQKAMDEGRIGDFPYDARYPVSVFADIGWADNTSLWFLQFVNHQARVIDCYQSQFQKTPHYIQVMNDRRYIYNKICLPHDAENEHANADRTWMQIFRQSFPNSTVYSGKRQAIELRLEATKNMFDTMCFHKSGTIDGRSALAHYHYATDPNTGKSTREPFHGPESNYSDAFGYMCLEMKESGKKQEAKKKTSIYSGMA